MPWCPKCGAEYTPGFDRCVGCKAPLIDQKPALSQPWYSRRPAIGVLQLVTVWIAATAIIIFAGIVGEALPVFLSNPFTIAAVMVVCSAFLLGYIADDWMRWPYISLGWVLAFLPVIPPIGYWQGMGWMLPSILNGIVFSMCVLTGATSTMIGQRFRQSRNGWLLLIPCALVIAVQFVIIRISLLRPC